MKIIKKCRKAGSGDKQERGEIQEVKIIRKWRKSESGEKQEGARNMK